MGKNKSLDEGTVVLIDKPTPPTEISSYAVEKMKPKKPLSEKQKANLAKLIERTKQRALERRQVVSANMPESIPEDKIAVVVKPKRKYVRKAPHFNANPAPEAPPAPPVQPQPSPASPPPLPPRKKAVKKKPETPVETETETESEYERPPPPRRHKERKPAKKEKPKKRYETDTSETTDWSDDESSSDDERVEKYVRKAQKRMQAVQEIENRLKTMANPYHARGISIF